MKNRLPFENHLNRFKNSGLIQNNFQKVKIFIFIFFFNFQFYFSNFNFVHYFNVVEHIFH